MDLMSTTVRNKRVPISIFMGTFDDPDKYLTTIWEFLVLREYCVRDCHEYVMYVCMVITYSRVWINRVRLPILLVVS